METQRVIQQPDQAFKDLLECWKNSPHPSVKITSYFPAYAELFSYLRDTECTFIETGILDGGSLFMWRSWLGDKARIIGVDLNPAAAKWNDHGFEIYIGDQGDPKFWQETLKKIGSFDVLLDDGGHQSFQQIVTVNEAIRVAKKRCVIVVEDTATSFMNDFSSHGNHSFLEYSKAATDVLIGSAVSLYKNRFPQSINSECIEFFKFVYSIQFFNGIVAYKIDPDKSGVPELVRNMPPNKATDFRYEGKSSAYVNWPSPFKTKAVTVRGGLPFIQSMKDKIIKALPDVVKEFLKKYK
ncbi:hypothetical protein [Chryseolinea sp. H1M3-3]|uniref:hypothetical protein n=1 Tax=Chryseolinea sp. H1M3-3 TaxID=3034144 RepID=UPI0023EBC977|nr:hypothetical protein [Chryseolinea sp. H1M3-3]